MARRANAAKAARRLQHAQNLAAAANGSEFQAETLARTRELVTDTLKRLFDARDPKDRELLSRSLSHLAEVERRLSGRALPGSRRPDASSPAAPRPSSALPDPR